MTQAVMTHPANPLHQAPLHKTPVHKESPKRWPLWAFILTVVVGVALLAGGLLYLASRTPAPSSNTSGSASSGQSASGGSSGSSSGGTSGGSSNSSGTPGAAPSQGGTNQGGQPSSQYQVLVYFSRHPESDNDPGATFAVKRTSPDLGVGTYAISQLLAGPTSSEAANGYFTTVRLRDGTSNCGGADFSLNISGGTARLQFCKPFDHLGVVADGQAESELKATLKQFPAVQKVVILNYKGGCEFDLSGLNLCQQ